MRTLMLLLSILCWGSASANDAREHPRETVVHAMGEDRIAAGPRAQVGEAVAGDLILAGGEVFAIAPVGGDLLVAGGNLRIDADTGQDLYAAGGNVTLNGSVKRNARMAGGQLEIGSRASVSGNATLAGGSVIVLGDVRGHLAVAGGRLYLSGRVGGDVDASGGEIELGPNARIAGDLRYRSSSELRRSPGAEVQGAIVREPGEAAWGDQAKTGLRIAGAVLLIWTLGLMLLGAVCVAVLPGFSARLPDTVRTRPGMSLLLGFAVLFATPALVSLLAATVIGLPLGLLLLAGYLSTLLLGHVSAGVILGQMGLRRLSPSRAETTGWRALAASLALFAIGLLAAVPLVGWLAWFGVWLAGIGAFLLQLRSTAQARLPGAP